MTINKHSATPKAMYAARTNAPATKGQKRFVEAGRHGATDKVQANLPRIWWKKQSH